MKIFILSSLAIIFACQPGPQHTEAAQVSATDEGVSLPAPAPSSDRVEDTQEKVDTEEVVSLPITQEARPEVVELPNKVQSPEKKTPPQEILRPKQEQQHTIEPEQKDAVDPEIENIDARSQAEEIQEMEEPEALLAGISHASWNTLVAKYVSASGKVNYKGFLSSKAELQTYLDLLSSNPPSTSWSKNEQLAYWINAYNAFTVKLIIDNYPLKSIMDLGKPWDKNFINIGGKSYTLNNIEHDIIRKQFDEPRIHFAVNCASISCPILLNEAYTADKLNGQLDKQTRAYINNPQENSLSASSAEISSLFDWYKGDFTKKGSLIQFLNTYADTQVSSSASISYKNYNWSLNE